MCPGNPDQTDRKLYLVNMEYIFLGSVTLLKIGWVAPCLITAWQQSFSPLASQAESSIFFPQLVS